jgi:hypothetical protein
MMRGTLHREKNLGGQNNRRFKIKRMETLKMNLTKFQKAIILTDRKIPDFKNKI